ncbi:MAG: winged helix DNA-binding domain-containing protein [Candidatus Bathyarchaeota archaeon]|nr:winged helix DNA-binding domain-containing protein [Candidatus Bathyarchaeota archaeon]
MENIKPREISKETARRFLISKQSFLQQAIGKNGTLEAIRRLECVQKDPISVVHRNHQLVLHSRVVDYNVSHLDDLLYKDRLVFEYWCNAKSIIPIEDFSYFHYRMKNPSEFHSPFYERIKVQRKRLKTAISHVLSEIRKHGPLSAREFEQKRKIKGKVATRVLNLLWDCGDLMIHHVERNRRYYDLTERVLPPNVVEMAGPSREEYKRFMIQKYMNAYGLIDTRNWRFGWLKLKASQRKTIVKELVEEDKLFPVKIDGVKQVYYVLKEHSSLLENSGASLSEKVHFLAPLDNLLWNRRMISEIFDFDYAWEVYKIPEKRVYGYYVMPILYGTRFIGRLDPKLDRQGQKMIINSLLLEQKDFDKDLMNELGESLKRFLEFHDTSQVSIVRTQPKKLKDALIRELNRLGEFKS